MVYFVGLINNKFKPTDQIPKDPSLVIINMISTVFIMIFFITNAH